MSVERQGSTPDRDQTDQGYRFAALREALREGETLSVKLDGQDLLLCQYRERVYAFENRCPHQGRAMDGALIRRGQLVCPHHGARFDLETGAPSGPLARCALKAFEVRLIASDVLVDSQPKGVTDSIP